MGVEQHHAIIVQSWDNEMLDVAYAQAKDIFPHVSPILDPKVNGYKSFYVPPDGSAEGWPKSVAGDEARKIFYGLVVKLPNLTVLEVTWGELGSKISRPREGGLMEVDPPPQ